jgi:hypothetical protein
MADFRQIHTRIWKDDWFTNLDQDAKLLFIYLFSNEQAEIGGVYELPIKYMAFESGLLQERIQYLLNQFEESKKVYYRNGWVWVVNLRKYNETGSPLVAKRIAKDLAILPDGELKAMYYAYYKIPYKYPINTLSIPCFNNNDSMHTPIEKICETETETESKGNTAAASPMGIYCAVTNRMGFPGSQEAEDIGALQTIITRESDPVDYLRPFYAAFKKRYAGLQKDFWLTDWAIVGAIPDPKKNGTSNGYNLHLDNSEDSNAT